ncbi:hypothetical protein R6Q59_023965 [Mikania micrantha]
MAPLNLRGICQLLSSFEIEGMVYYEFGIFSTFFMGKEIPNWINCRSKGPTLSFTIPPSPKKLRGLNLLCIMEKVSSLPLLGWHDIAIPMIKISHIILECGIGLVYDDDEGNIGEEEDVLGYYKSWNHIIGGDLSPFQTTTGEYILDHNHFCRFSNETFGSYHPFISDGTNFKEEEMSSFKAFSPKKQV